MRSRKKIEQELESNRKYSFYAKIQQRVTLEVLLDIRDLLEKELQPT